MKSKTSFVCAAGAVVSFGLMYGGAYAASIQGLLFQDTNRNGTYNNCEFPISEYTVQAIKCGTNEVVSSSSTIQNGAGCGDDLACLRGSNPNVTITVPDGGNYKIKFTPTGAYAAASYETKETTCLNGSTNFGQVGVMGTSDPFPGHDSFANSCVTVKSPVWQCTINGWIKTNEERDGANYNGNIQQKPRYNVGDKVSVDPGITPNPVQCPQIEVKCAQFTINGKTVARNAFPGSDISKPGSQLWGKKITLSSSEASKLAVLCSGGIVGGGDAQQNITVRQLFAGTTYQQYDTSNSCWSNPYSCDAGDIFNNPAVKVVRPSDHPANQLSSYSLDDKLVNGDTSAVYDLAGGTTFKMPRYAGNPLWIDNVGRNGRDWRFRTYKPAFGSGIYAVSCKTYYGGGEAYKEDLCGSQLIEVVDDAKEADIQITKSVDKATFPNNTGEIIKWTLQYKNNGPITAEKVVITDQLPKEFSFYGELLPNATLLPGNKIEWSIGTLLSGQTGSISFSTKYNGGATDLAKLENKVSIITITKETTLTNNTGSAITSPIKVNVPTTADIQIIKSVNKPIFPNVSGEIINWTLNYLNNGPATAEKVVISDQLPTGLAIYGTLLPGITLLPGNKIQWSIGTLLSGQGGTITFSTKYLGGIASWTKLDNKVGIITSTPETTLVNNISTATTVPTPAGNAKLGNYVWYDGNNNGIQDSNEKGAQGVTVQLFSGCSNATTPYAVTFTNASGYYQFDNLMPGEYSVKFLLPNGYKFASLQVGSNREIDNNASAEGKTSCVNLAESESNQTIDAGLVVKDPVSCDGLILKTGGNLIEFDCRGSHSVTNRFEIKNSAGAIVYTSNLFVGQTTLLTPGMYTAQCIMDGGVTYKVTTYQATQDISCAYKQHSGNGSVCAVSLNSLSFTKFDINKLLAFPQPVELCTIAQQNDATYQCISAPAGSQIWTKDPTSCTKTFGIGMTAKLGDYVWNDVNKDGLQNDGNVGINGITMKLYQCNETVRGTSDPASWTKTHNYNGTYLGTVITDSNGYYEFANLDPNAFYYVVASVPSQWTVTTQFKDGYATYGQTNSNFASNGFSTCEKPEMAIDLGLYQTSCAKCPGSTQCMQPGEICSGDPFCPYPTYRPSNAPSNVCCPYGQTWDQTTRSCGGCPTGMIECDGQCRNQNSCGSPLTCEWSDPPTINRGEYYPTFWGFAPSAMFANNLTAGCSNPDDVGKLIKNTIKCRVKVQDGKGGLSENELVDCFSSDPILSTQLFSPTGQFKDTLGTAWSLFNSSRRHGAKVFKTDKTASKYTILGEYSFSVGVESYDVCRVTIGGTPSNPTYSYYKERTTPTSIPACHNNFMISDSYVSSQNGGLSSISANTKLSDYYEFGGTKVVLDVSQTQGQKNVPSSTLSYILSDFIKKYDNLKNAQGKVGNKEIYINADQSKVIGLNNKSVTLLYDRSITLNLKSLQKLPNSMIVSSGTLTITVDDDFCSATTIPTFKGVIIARDVRLQRANGDTLKNDRTNKSWCRNGNLKISGLLVTAQDPEGVYKNTRSTVGTYWFNVPSDPIQKAEARKQAIYRGGSLLLETQPSLWLSLPPGAGELLNQLKITRTK